MSALVHFREEPPRLVKFFVLPPEKTTLSRLGLLAVSPDGRRLVFGATLDGKSELWVRDLDSLAARPLPGTEGASYPFWSPDSRSIGFFAEQETEEDRSRWRASFDSVRSRRPRRGGSWSQNGVIVFAVSREWQLPDFSSRWDCNLG